MSSSDARKVTPFERRVYDLCSRIPPGKVSTYGDMADVLGSHARAVGQALRRNPYAPEVPCHRVVAKDRKLGGFSGEWGDASPQVKRKKGMLECEGVRFDGGLISKASIASAAEMAVLGKGLSKGTAEGAKTAKPPAEAKSARGRPATRAPAKKAT